LQDWNGCAAKGAASGVAAARIFLPQLVDFDLNLLNQVLWILLLFDSKKKARIFLLNVHQLPTRDMAGLWSGCAAKSAVASGCVGVRPLLTRRWRTIIKSIRRWMVVLWGGPSVAPVASPGQTLKNWYHPLRSMESAQTAGSDSDNMHGCWFLRIISIPQLFDI
jgi:hypothetical protein